IASEDTGGLGPVSILHSDLTREAQASLLLFPVTVLSRRDPVVNCRLFPHLKTPDAEKADQDLRPPEIPPPNGWPPYPQGRPARHQTPGYQQWREQDRRHA